MKKKTLILLGGLLISTVTAYAQTEKVYVTNKRSRFFNTPPSQRIEVEHMNVVKFDLLNQLNGEMRFSYEHVVGDKSSIELTAGPNVSNIWSGRFLSQYGGEVGKMGVSAEVGFRYYPLRELSALNQFYIMPAVGVKHFNSEYHAPVLEGQVTPDPFSGNDTRIYYTFNIGYQHWVSKTMSIDYFIGMGLAQRNQSSAYTTYNWSQNGEMTTEWVQESTSFPTVQINAGLRFGIGWSSL
ncbi:Protein of unknown function [Lishizhenia tianjinensis]|uniref:Outer membrane protein beta-barrel domain-containing protein n=1 Tax=Lishizhenia tianjinensis TaxID=477690 RepID=A0A1I6XI98_9FLAO|nr:DUF3575 domain-containing protein [Lishizhenia tianjinensis]SFT38045.1 Protein of unknown function [Lishizhenia tianjinensis]